MKTVYRAYDGKEFDDRYECKSYEQELAENQIKSEASSMNVAELLTHLPDRDDDVDEDDYYGTPREIFGHLLLRAYSHQKSGEKPFKPRKEVKKKKAKKKR